MEEVESVKIKTDKIGVVLKADTLGSLEALTACLNDLQIPIRMADIGDISKRDIVEAAVVKQKEPLYAVVLGFNVKVLQDAEEEAMNLNLRIFRSDIVYHLVEEYRRWLEKERAVGLQTRLDLLVLPGKIRILPGHVFRRSKPAIVGVEVQAGRIKPRCELINESRDRIGSVVRIQDKGNDISEARKGTDVAISIDKPTVGRQIKEGDILYIAVPERHVKELLSKHKDQLSVDELDVLEQLIKIMREDSPLWAL